jgi:PAS domain S-box-containing protein
VSCAFLLPMVNGLRRNRGQQRAAALADRRLAQVVRQANDAIIALDPAGCVQSWNPAAERIFGFTEAEMRGQTLDVVTADDAQRADQQALVQAVLAGRTVTAEVARRHKSGRPLQLRVSAAPLYDERQRVMGVSGVLQDITERKQAEQRLREADRQKDEFLAVLAHELRNPLSPLVSGVELLRLPAVQGETRERSLAMMDRQLGHMVRMVNDLLDVSRIGQGRLVLARAPVALRAVVDDALAASRALLQAQGHRLSVAVEDDLVVNADATRLAQVLSNLLNNAAKYTPPGGDIELTARRHGEQGQQVRVCVADSGMGIPADQLQRVFELFAQVPDAAARAMGGLGIGLSIARKLVELHGGTLQAESAGRDRGSRFTVTLPLAAQAPHADAAAVDARPQRLRLVVADDNRDAAMSLAELLQLEGHEVHVVHDGLQAVEAAQALCPDAMLLDIGMPRLDGLQAAARIRAAAGTGAGAGVRTPLLIAVSGWGQESDLQRSSEAGFDHHLTKPVRLEELRAVLPT